MAIDQLDPPGFHCGSMLPAMELPDAGDGACCWGAVIHGAHGCTCWVPVYEQEQQPPRPGPAEQRKRLCAQCAYRPGSPERRGEKGYAGDAESLEDLALTGSPFACHEGMRRPVAYRHPSGVTVPAHPAAYDPPVIGGVAYKADGSPADLCAGWHARRQWHDRQESPDGQ